MSLEDSNHLAAVTLKIPLFWPSDPQIWFAQVEAQFNTKGITAQKIKFEHIISSLAPEVAQEVRDLILSPINNKIAMSYIILHFLLGLVVATYYRHHFC